MFRNRHIEPELLDHADPEEARKNLADLVRLNRNFGGHSTIRYLLRQAGIAPADRFTILDIGAASGDTARVITSDYPNAQVTCLDHNPVNLGLAPEPRLIADALHLPFRPASFDFVINSLFLHHFEDDQVAQLLRSFHAIARRALLVADLERSILPGLFMRASKPIFGWGYITVHDGLISFRAAFTRKELTRVALQAGLANAVVRAHHPAFRLTLVAKK